MKPKVKTPLRLKDWFSTDVRLYQLYPEAIRSLARMHWSPLYIIQKVIPYLTPNDRVKVLDIGSGVGTFCLAGAYYNQSVPFFGVEQRKKLVEVAEDAREKLGIQNVSFIHGNFTQLNLTEFDHFYFYNSFFENLNGAEKIDNEIVYSNELYNYYCIYLYNQLEKMPVGTRIATYCSWGDEIPPGYQLAETHFDNLLKFWIKL
ncbi:methyltransferase [Niastella koreensis]|uniref:Methyltransferase n=2 Tax=Niastella koreensis TaxID=354356 RepID=G8TKV7_NIAKG|nr:methyltransferase domain-containing protein [Niastella koreensis]AEV99786.1 methyltransferase [Niastella koreensis GR20-10]OQP51594.1 methyltransferase [Niastella koreensis]